MAAFYKEDVIDIELNSGTIHRSFLQHSIGTGDNAENWFGVRVFRGGEPVDLTGASVQGFFRDPMGNNIAITSGNYVSGNVAEVLLPQACYNYEGQFCLAIKLVSSEAAGTMRIVDGMVSNTNTGGAVAPTETVPTYQEILATYDSMVAALAQVAYFDDYIENGIGLNLIGNLMWEYYPVYIPKNETVTVSTSDGSTLPSGARIYAYDENLTLVDWFSIGSEFGTYRTKVISTATDVYFVALNVQPTVPLMMVYGSTPLTYKPYVWPNGRTMAWHGYAPTNIDTMLQAGFYRLEPGRTFTTLPSVANGKNNTLAVYYPTFDNAKNIQILYVNDSNTPHVFARITSSGSAGAWQKMIRERDTIAVSNLNINNSNAATICGSDLNTLPVKKMYGVAANTSLAHMPVSLGGYVFTLSQHDNDYLSTGSPQFYIDSTGVVHSRINWGSGGFTEWKTPVYSGSEIVAGIKVLALGDSICRGGRNDSKGFIGDIGCLWVNIGVGGATISTKVDTSETDDTPHFLGAANIPDELVKYAQHTSESWYLEPDVIIAEGGINDYMFNAPLGDMPSTPANTDAQASALDQSTMSGGLGFLCYQMIKLYPKARHLFLITHQQRNCAWTANTAGYTQAQMRERIMAICQMYGVEIIDVYSTLSSYFPQNVSPTRYVDDHSVTNLYLIDKDEIHPLALGYKKFYAPQVLNKILGSFIG